MVINVSSIAGPANRLLQEPKISIKDGSRDWSVSPSPTRESDYSALVFSVTHRNSFLELLLASLTKNICTHVLTNYMPNKVFYSTSSKRAHEPPKRYIQRFLSAGHCHRTNRLVLVVFKLFKRMISHNQSDNQSLDHNYRNEFSYNLTQPSQRILQCFLTSLEIA